MENEWTKEIEALRERVRELETELESHAWEISPAMAQAKIEELEGRVRMLEAEIADHYQTFRRIMDEKCPADEVHCACVPYLRIEIKKLTAERDRLKEALIGLLLPREFQHYDEENKLQTNLREILPL